MIEKSLDNQFQYDGETVYEHHKLVVDDHQLMMRIDKFLTNQIANMTRNKVQKLAEHNFILVNNVAVKSSYRLQSPRMLYLLLKIFQNEIIHLSLRIFQFLYFMKMTI